MPSFVNVDCEPSPARQNLNLPLAFPSQRRQLISMPWRWAYVLSFASCTPFTLRCSVDQVDLADECATTATGPFSTGSFGPGRYTLCQHINSFSKSKT